MTARELERDFPLRSALAVRAPIDVPEDEQLLELEDELAKRRRVYPGFVERGTMTEEQASHHINVWQALIDDHRRTAAKVAHWQRHGFERPATRLMNDPPWRGTWDGRIRELRRELALRRTAYPKWIANPTNPLTEAEARRKLERLDAIHHRYWIGLEHFIPPLPAAHPDEAAQLATLSAADYLRHPLIRADFDKIRDMVAWQQGLLPLRAMPDQERTFHVTALPQRPTAPAYWTGRGWARGNRWDGPTGPIGPHQPLDFHPSYFREQEQAA